MGGGGRLDADWRAGTLRARWHTVAAFSLCPSHAPILACAPDCRRDLAAAIWRPALGLAEVVLQKGKVLSHMGFTRGAKLFLFVEEAV